MKVGGWEVWIVATVFLSFAPPRADARYALNISFNLRDEGELGDLRCTTFVETFFTTATLGCSDESGNHDTSGASTLASDSKPPASPHNAIEATMNTFATKVKPIGKPTTTAQSPAPADTNNPLDSTAKSTTSTKAGVPINVKPIRKPTSTKSSTTSTRTTPSVNQSQRPTRKPITTPGNPPNNNQPPAASSAGLTGPASGAVSAPSAGPGPASSNQNNPPPAISTPVTSTTSTNSRPPPPPPPPPPASTPSTSSSGQASPADIQNALNAHNAARAKHGEVPLVWDTSLAAAAKAYSEYLAQLGFLKHNSTGENLYSYFPVNNRPLLQATNAWVAEEPKYQGEPIPQGPFLSYGHYTQVVWNTTLRVGMGFTINGSHTYVVARYLPVGNILGFTPY